MSIYNYIGDLWYLYIVEFISNLLCTFISLFAIKKIRKQIIINNSDIII